MLKNVEKLKTSPGREKIGAIAAAGLAVASARTFAGKFRSAAGDFPAPSPRAVPGAGGVHDIGEFPLNPPGPRSSSAVSLSAETCRDRNAVALVVAQDFAFSNRAPRRRSGARILPDCPVADLPDRALATCGPPPWRRSRPSQCRVFLLRWSWPGIAPRAIFWGPKWLIEP